MHIGAPKLLPAWFVGRMTDSIGDFAFLLTTGDVVHFATITAIRQDVTGALWIDVMVSVPPKRVALVSHCGEERGWLWRVAPQSADTASIRADQIVAAVDLTDRDAKTHERPVTAAQRL